MALLRFLRRPRFQFSLRTLFIAVTLFAIGSYAVSQAGIVMCRKSILDSIQGHTLTAMRRPSIVARPLPWTRRMMGDFPVEWIGVDRNIDDAEFERIVCAFPEAKVERLTVYVLDERDY
jgi:hypothetical protein